MNYFAKWLVGMLVIFNNSNSSFAGETIRLSNGEFLPYLSEDLKYYGVLSRIVSEAFALEDIEVKYWFFPWGRAIAVAENGAWDGSLGWVRKSDREENFYYSDPVMQMNSVFFHLKVNSFDWSSFDDLQRINIGGVIGLAIPKELKDKGLSVEFVREDVHNFRKLLKKRIDIFPMDIEGGYLLMSKELTFQQSKMITHHHKSVHRKDIHLILPRKLKRNQRFLKLFNRGLKQLKKTGKYDQFIDESRSGKYLKR